MAPSGENLVPDVEFHGRAGEALVGRQENEVVGRRGGEVKGVERPPITRKAGFGLT